MVYNILNWVKIEMKSGYFTLKLIHFEAFPPRAYTVFPYLAVEVPDSGTCSQTLLAKKENALR